MATTLARSGAMPVAEDHRTERERVLNPVLDGLGSGAGARRTPPVVGGPTRAAGAQLAWHVRPPPAQGSRLGWITADPLTARAVLDDPEHFTLLTKAASDAWSGCGRWVYDLFDGGTAGPPQSRAVAQKTSAAFVERAWGPRLAQARAELEGGGDLAGARILVGQMVVTLLGMPIVATTGHPGMTHTATLRDRGRTGIHCTRHDSRHRVACRQDRRRRRPSWSA